jgi:hypothetical protein
LSRSLRARCAGLSSLRFCAAAILCICVTRPQSAHAISTVSARFEPPRIVSGVRQPVAVLLTYFPGNGEAVTQASFRLSTGGQIHSARASRGQTSLIERRVVLDYLSQPVGESLTDTLWLEVETDAEFSLQASLITTFDTDAQTLHRPSWSLPVSVPLEVRWSLTPQVWYPGESLPLEISVESTDLRPVEGLIVSWPAGVVADPADADPWPLTQATGRYHQRLRIPADLPETLQVSAGAQGSGLTHSPVASIEVQAGPVPHLVVEAPQVLRRGSKGTVRLIWSSDREMSSVDLQVQVEGLQAIEALAASNGFNASIDFDTSTGQALIEMPDVALRAGEPVVATLQLTPRHTGPLVFRSSFTPADRSEVISTGRTDVVPVVEPGGSVVDGETQQPVLTDLELARKGLSVAWQEALVDLPLPAGAVVSLQAEGKHDANWMVEEAMTGALLDRDIRLPLASDATAYELRYRVAASQATYEHRGAIWNPFQSSKARNAMVNVHGRLVDPAGRLVWARRVEAQGQDVVGSDAALRLGGADAVEQSLVPANQRALEAGLSGLIVGGLFFVFFSP